MHQLVHQRNVLHVETEFLLLDFKRTLVRFKSREELQAID